MLFNLPTIVKSTKRRNHIGITTDHDKLSSCGVKKQTIYVQYSLSPLFFHLIEKKNF